MPRLSRPAILSSALAVVLAMLLGAVALAQDTATPVAVETAPVIVPRPAHIHAGSCGNLGDVVFPLTDVPTVPVQTIPSFTAVGESITTIDASLNEVLASPHAVNVHASAESIEDYIACGDVAGTVTAGRLVVPLGELNGSGFTGEAVLVDSGDGTTTVALVLVGTGGTTAQPGGTTPPAAGATPAADVAAGTVLATTSDNVRVRAEPTTEAEILTILPTGAQVEVTGAPEEADGYLWYPVTVQDDEGASGWIAADFVAPAEGSQ